jgi:TonB family protein
VFGFVLWFAIRVWSIFLRMKNMIVVTALLAFCFSAGWAQNAQNGSAVPRAPTKVRVSGRVLDAFIIKKVMPQPPWTKDDSKKEGTAMLKVWVGRDGKVEKTTFDGGDSVLGEVAAQAVRQWEFRPYFLAGSPVQVESTVTMKFSKDQAEVIFPNE